MKKLLTGLLLLCLVPAVYGAYPEEYPIYLQYLGFKKGEIRDLQSGSIITHSIKNKLPGEFGSTVARVVRVPPYYFRDYYTAIENFKTAAEFHQVGKFKPLPVLQDLEALQLNSSEMKELVMCQPENCGFRLSVPEISRIPRDASIETDAGKVAVAEAFRKILFDRLLSYQKTNRSSAQSAGDPFVAQMIRFPDLTAYFPNAKQYLVEYPLHKNKFTPEFFYWAKESKGGKPVVSIHHVFSQRVGDDFIVVNNLVYASHYFVSGIGVLHLINYADGGLPSTLLVAQQRIATDLTGNLVIAAGRDFMALNMERDFVTSLEHIAKSTETRYRGRLYVTFPYELAPTDQR